MSFEINASDFINRTRRMETSYKKGARKGMQRSVVDLRRIASQLAPILSSTLRKSGKHEVKDENGSVIGEVYFSATNEGVKFGRFNYALWTHEYLNNSNLGERSLSAGGTDGYSVGNKYLSRPLYGESDKYLKWIEEEIMKELGG